MATTTILCKQCNFENEPERVYCHNCGAKLDRTLLPIEAIRRDDPVVVQERVRKMMSPKRGSAKRVFKNLALTLLISVALAAFVQIVRPPRDIPNISQDAVMSAPAIRDDMENVTQQPSARRLAYPEDQVNAFLQYAVRSKDESFFGIPLKFERVFLHLEEGSCRITTQQSIFGFPIYAADTYAVSIDGGKVVPRNLGGAFGRLSLPGSFMNLINPLIFGSLWSVFGPEQKLLARMQSITFHKAALEIVSKPGAH